MVICGVLLEAVVSDGEREVVLLVDKGARNPVDSGRSAGEA